MTSMVVMGSLVAFPGSSPGQIPESAPGHSRSTLRATTISQAEQASDQGIADIATTTISPANSPRNQAIDFFPDFERPTREKYITTIELASIAWPEKIGAPVSHLGGRLILGLNRPYYTVKRDLRLIGTLDFKLDGMIFGVTNTARVSFKYDLTRPRTSAKTSMQLSVYQIAMKFGIPFGPVQRTTSSN
jgi:hypothetical protein